MRLNQPSPSDNSPPASLHRWRATVSLIFLLTLWFSAQTTAQGQQVSIVAAEYPPYLGTDLKQNGPFGEIINTVYQLNGDKSRIEFVPWARAIKVAQRGDYDGLLGAWYTEQRAKVFVYSDPFVPAEIGLYKLKSKTLDYKTLADLKPYSIGIVRDYINPPGFDEAKLATITVTKDEQNLVLLCKNHIDLMLTDKTLGAYLAKTKYPECSDKIEWLGTLEIKPHYLVISKKINGHQAKIAAFNRGLRQLKKVGTLDKILARHGLKNPP